MELGYIIPLWTLLYALLMGVYIIVGLGQGRAKQEPLQWHGPALFFTIIWCLLTYSMGELP